MARTKQTLTKAEKEAMDAQNRRAENRAKQMAEEAACNAPKSSPMQSFERLILLGPKSLENC